MKKIVDKFQDTNINSIGEESLESYILFNIIFISIGK